MKVKITTVSEEFEVVVLPEHEDRVRSGEVDYDTFVANVLPPPAYSVEVIDD